MIDPAPIGVSIVMPAYNAADHVHTSLDSILGLDYPADRLELLVVDDGSTDDTIARVRALLHDAHFEWRILRQANAGPAAARNTGWQAARYEWIQFLDTDDYLASTKLRLQAPAAANADAKVAVIYSPWARKPPAADKSRLEPRNPSIRGDHTLALLRSDGFLMTGCQLYRRGWLRRVGGFDTDLKVIEDVNLDLRLAMLGGGFVGVPSDFPVAVYCMRDGSLSQRDRKRFIHGCVHNAKMVEGHWRTAAHALDRERVGVLMSIYGMGLRYYAAYDLASFRALYTHMRHLSPDFASTGRVARKLAPVTGHYVAEIVVGRIRRLLGRE